ncbi:MULTISPECIES: helix-turn-helix domain-containing protein [unclassified Curtobacterium]|uniref:helix-turn-helix domain-containing protein n=1 Tax=unclassified Curtobacterium TaxID=257496 RepID=UPI0008DCB3BB|nr:MULTISPECIES: helix-turn-helix transcriptional regulator [unclassified Curtobacterium]OIH99486.1 XRE family transcriptional regulator [Curtobacterium sp. MCBA15_003]OII11391.1 XRE family transcriptional regulator [Curtobacterium sp. MCBA15_009]OII30682.1 XRE family transcriptional regulator [Curtobacterium sp. MMLR14_006]
MNEMRIGELRRLRGWTQERLAETSGIAVRTVQRMESGNDASLESLSAVASALEVPVRDLFVTAEPAALEPGVRGLDERAERQQTQRDAVSRGWRYLYSGLGIVVTLGTLALIGSDVWAGAAIFVIPVYWAGGRLLSQFLMATVVEPSLDRRYPSSRSNRVTRGS